MKFTKIALIDHKEGSLEPDILAKLKDMADSVVFVDSSDQERFNKEIKDADVFFTRYHTRITKDMIDLAPNLKYIGIGSISVRRVDTEYAASKNIVATNAAGYCDNGIAEFVFATILSQARELEKARSNVRNGDFSTENYMGYELGGKTFGIIGLGRIGKRVAEIALGMGMKVRHFSRSKKDNLVKSGIEYREVDQLCAESDVIGVFIPDDTSTKSMIGAEVLSKIRQGALMISISHTDVFDFESLITSLAEGRFSLIQTYMDTISDEQKQALMNSKNVILYPSIAIQTKETRKKQQDIMVNNLAAFLEGKPVNRVN